MKTPDSRTTSHGTDPSSQRRKNPNTDSEMSLATVWILRAFTFISLVAIWEWYGQRVNQALFAPPSRIISSFRAQLFDEAVLLPAFIEMNIPLAVGFSAAIVVGTLSGLAMGRWKRMYAALNPFVNFVYAVPGVTLIPVFILWFGLDLKLTFALVFVASAPPIAISTAVGARQVEAGLSDVAASVCASPWQEIRTVLIPGTVPFILSGVQTGLAQAIIAVIVAELTTVLRGMGGLIQVYAASFQTANMLVPIIMVAGQSVALVSLMKFVRRRFAPWSIETEW